MNIIKISSKYPTTVLNSYLLLQKQVLYLENQFLVIHTTPQIKFRIIIC